MNQKNLDVLVNVIGAVESGGQVYGKRNYKAYTAPYTNSSIEHTITLGWCQFYGSEAKRLIQMILNKDSEGFGKLDSAGIEEMLSKDWVSIRWNPTSAQKEVLISLIDSPAGHASQDELFKELMQKFISDCEAKYTKDVKAVMMYCEIRHLGGSAVNRIFERLNGDYSLDAIMASLVRDQKDITNDNQVGDFKFWSRHLKCKEFIERYAGEESMSERQKILNVARSWMGYNEGDGSHRKIVDIYNAHRPLARGYKVQYSDAWCATFVSACAIKAGLTNIIPTECGCGDQVELFKKLGEWVEDDGYVPSAGDIIYYDWGDSGSGDNKGWSDHVGIVESCDGRYISVIEGNKNDAVGRRVIEVNGRYIRGFGVPKYSDDDAPAADPENKLPAVSKSKFTVSGKGYPNDVVVFTGTVKTVLNVRKWAGTSNATCSFSPLQTGVKVEVCDSIKADDGSTWYFIKYNGKYGFVHSSYVSG